MSKQDSEKVFTHIYKGCLEEQPHDLCLLCQVLLACVDHKAMRVEGVANDSIPCELQALTLEKSLQLMRHNHNLLLYNWYFIDRVLVATATALITSCMGL